LEVEELAKKEGIFRFLPIPAARPPTGAGLVTVRVVLGARAGDGP